MGTSFLLKEVQDLAQDILDESKGKLTYQVAFESAIKIQQNKLFAQAFVITISDSAPTALEAIAIALTGHSSFLPKI